MKLSAIALVVGFGLMSATVYAADQTTTGNNTGTTKTMTTATGANAGEAFLQKNKGKQGVVTLPDGLQYKVITQGKGEKPKSTDVVTVHYEGKLIDGKEFDSSYKRGEPATFPVNGVIAGWTEALQLMPVGSTWELFIPASLAYGEQGAPPAIGPNETLVFKVQLLSVKKG